MGMGIGGEPLWKEGIQEAERERKAEGGGGEAFFPSYFPPSEIQKLMSIFIVSCLQTCETL